MVTTKNRRASRHGRALAVLLTIGLAAAGTAGPAAGRTIGQMPFEHWFGPGVIVDISDTVSNSSVYTPAMIEERVDIQKGDILIIKTGYYKYGWNSPDSDEFRYMIKHPGPSPDFADWCLEKEIKWLGIDCVAMEHPMKIAQQTMARSGTTRRSARKRRPTARSSPRARSARPPRPPASRPRRRSARRRRPPAR